MGLSPAQQIKAHAYWYAFRHIFRGACITIPLFLIASAIWGPNGGTANFLPELWRGIQFLFLIVIYFLSMMVVFFLVGMAFSKDRKDF